ncbi:Signal peptidase complex subunit 3 [Gryllus bimaculatus]|nr:Signal peptidase complex subunit 3 [Gryllus bimaculatus]
MHSVLTRGNAILAYSLSVLAVLTFVCFISTVFIDYRTNATMNTVKVVVKNVADYSASREKNDLGFLTFDLQTDILSLIVVLWDKIIQRGENAVLDFKNMNTKYYFWDDGNGLRGNQNVTLTLSWNIIPNAGLLPSIFALGSHAFRFPVEYTTARV